MRDDPDKLDHALSIRVNLDDIGRLNALAARIPIATRHALARAALRIGLDALEADPTRVVSQPLPKRGGARVAKKKRAGR